jgi:hypothetical protein
MKIRLVRSSYAALNYFASQGTLTTSFVTEGINEANALSPSALKKRDALSAIKN